MITIPRMHYALQILSSLGLGLLWLICGHIQDKMAYKGLLAVF
jgi:hypothetical protein